MVPKVAGKGGSFKGAGLYYLHDKKADTSERVAFTHTENLPTRDPAKAIKCMAWTALRQQELKTRSGGSAKGRKLTQPVYCYSLSWAPGEAPSQADMIGAAKDTLTALGLDGHEALFVGHNDEPHPHIHVIVNRVHPETGIAAKLSNDHLKLSAWAERFERLQGQIRCDERVINNALRQQGQFAKDRNSQHAAEFHRWREERAARRADNRSVQQSALAGWHETEREELRRARDGKIDALRQRLRDQTRADWRDLFAIQRQERQRLEKAQRTAWSRLRHYVKSHAETFRMAGRDQRRQMLKDAFFALIGSKRQYAELDAKQKKDRVFFAKKLRERIGPMTVSIRRGHEQELDALRKRQSRERQDQKFRHVFEQRAERRAQWKGEDRAAFEREQAEKPKSGADRLRDKFTAAGKALKQPESEKPPQSRPTPGDSLRERFRRARDNENGDSTKADEPEINPRKKPRGREPE